MDALQRTLTFDLSSARVSELHPPPETVPNCRRCGEPATEEVTRPSNRNGNAGRPYYKCHRCNKFLCFADDRGNDPNNPLCNCGIPSRRQVSGRHRRVSRGVHFVCRQGGCDFYDICQRDDGQHLSIESEDLLTLFVNLRIV